MLSMFIFIGGLRGAGDTRWTLAITMAGFWGIRVIASLSFGNQTGYGPLRAWIGMALDMAVRFSLQDCDSGPEGGNI